jgi:hypothetical protein
MPWFVSRQKYWPDGDLVVEIASGGRDYANPDMLSPKYAGEGEEYNDPREALDVALEIRDAWISDCKEEVRVEHGFTGGATMPFCSEPDDSELREWASAAYEKLPKCDRCGELIEGYGYGPPDFDPDLRFCREYCAEKYYADICCSEEGEEDD